MAQSSHNEPLRSAINLFSKPLKKKIFISQKSLDTPLFRLIRFRQKVLTEFCPVGTILPKREGRTLPGRSFCLRSQLSKSSRRWFVVAQNESVPGVWILRTTGDGRLLR